MDVCIIGAGIAGLTAAIYVQRAGLQSVIFERSIYGGQIIVSPTVDNYPGMPGIDGATLANAVYEQATAQGAELRFEADNNNNDYLVYGLTEEFFFSNPQLTQWRLKEFVAQKPQEALVYQAHPFRNGCCPMRREYLFGLEVFNGHGGHDNRNGLALQLARMEHYHAISGSDAHYEQYLCAGGILTDGDVNTPQELLQALTQDAYCLFNRNVTDKNHW